MFTIGTRKIKIFTINPKNTEYTVQWYEVPANRAFTKNDANYLVAQWNASSEKRDRNKRIANIGDFFTMSNDKRQFTAPVRGIAAARTCFLYLSHGDTKTACVSGKVYRSPNVPGFLLGLDDSITRYVPMGEQHYTFELRCVQSFKPHPYEALAGSLEEELAQDNVGLSAQEEQSTEGKIPYGSNEWFVATAAYLTGNRGNIDDLEKPYLSTCDLEVGGISWLDASSETEAPEQGAAPTNDVLQSFYTLLSTLNEVGASIKPDENKAVADGALVFVEDTCIDRHSLDLETRIQVWKHERSGRYVAFKYQEQESGNLYTRWFEVRNVSEWKEVKCPL